MLQLNKQTNKCLSKIQGRNHWAKTQIEDLVHQVKTNYRFVKSREILDELLQLQRDSHFKYSIGFELGESSILTYEENLKSNSKSHMKNQQSNSKENHVKINCQCNISHPRTQQDTNNSNENNEKSNEGFIKVYK